MYAHTSEGIWVIKMGQGDFPSDIGGQLTGTGEMLIDPHLMLEGSREGFLGTLHPNASINVAGWGYFFVDEVAGKVYRFNGEPEEISAYGMSQFFRNTLAFCGDSECMDEQTSVHYSMGWDHRLNRLLLTKHDEDSNDSFTISYTPVGGSDGRGKWLSFHSYLPDDYLWDRGQLFSHKGGKVYRHHKRGQYQTFYGDKFPFLVEFVVTDPQTFRAFTFANGYLLTEASRYSGKGTIHREGLDITFDQVSVWNDVQMTGVLDITPQPDQYDSTRNPLTRAQSDYSRLRMVRDSSGWAYNGLHDLSTNPCGEYISPISVDTDCQAVYDVSSAETGCEPMQQPIRNRVLAGRYLNFRWSFGVSTDVELRLLMSEVREDTNPTEKTL